MAASGHVRKVACHLCRQRKSACDGKEPRCGHCERKRLVCEYPARDKAPGIRAGYVSQLEQRLVLVENRLAEIEQRSLLCPAAASVSAPALAETGPSSYGPPAVEDAAPNALDSGIGYPTDMDQEERYDMAQPPAPSVEIPTLPFSSPASRAFGEGFGQEILKSLEHVSRSVLTELCTIWFEKHHPWFPILHQASLVHSLRASTDLSVSPRCLVLQAIVLATMKDSPSSRHMFEEWKDALISSVTLGVMSSLTLDAIQAGLILSNFHYGEGKLASAGHLIAVCCRLCNSLGLQQLVEKRDIPSTPVSSPASCSNTIIDREERIRAYWMAKTLDSISNLGSSHVIAQATIPTNPTLPCSESIWAFPEDTINDQLIGQFHYSSAFSLCVILAASELLSVHTFINARVDMSHLEEREQWQTAAQRIDERLTVWRDEFVAAVYRLINAEYRHHERPEMDPYIVLTNCVLNTTVLTLLQRRAPCPAGIDNPVESWAFASNRCVYACENTAFKVRHMQEQELRNCAPYLVGSIFAAARFYIVHSKALDADVPRNLHSLAFALHTCGSRWRLARLCEAIIRTAVADYRTPVVESKVPASFYDLRYTTAEIFDSMLVWAEGIAEDASPSVG